MNQRLAIIVLGASGDLAKKKTFPSLLDLFRHGYLPDHVVIVGFARSAMPDADFHARLRPYFKDVDDETIDRFLARVNYFNGGYDSAESFAALDSRTNELTAAALPDCNIQNRIFYFAIPPNVFLQAAGAIKSSARANGFNRLVVEKPFGHDLASAREMAGNLGALFDEDSIYRIDHYLGKEMVQNVIMFRFGNSFLEPLLNSRHVAAVLITFKENFGTQGRGGYFDNYGIIRDIMQNHLMQVMTLVAMEPPTKVAGDGYSNYVRDAKVSVLNSIHPLRMEDVVLGQYVADDQGNDGYLQDPTVPDNSKTATFAQAVFRISNPRWEGVPFIMKAGKALEERKAEIRIQFKDAPGAQFMFDGQDCPRNELVLRLQPSESVYFKVNVKKPGLFTDIAQSELDLSYTTRYNEVYSPDAYTRLLLDTLRGSQAAFVRSDELEGSWRIFDPLLKEIEGSGVQPEPYVYGSRGPASGDEMYRKLGYVRNSAYRWAGKK